ncbi:hypothetical protein BPAE_0273g00100 [Botrytis paeoniae]|uniref:Uncharacterized protein n=1 Tax=Botrytis paeoniae TaxID=278948 RepID=A0A4Z1FD52_9HELO|nr:hypothetical protein BPAE_0273g00100 [Botrytis paeoniae]
MANYNSRRPEMLDKLYEEGRSNMVYRYTFKDAQNDEAIALLPEQEKLQAIERAVYKKLFGDDPTDKKYAAKNPKSTAEPKKNEASKSNNNKNAGRYVPPTVGKGSDTQEARYPVDSNTTKVVSGVSHRDQAAKSPPPEEKQFKDRQKQILARHEEFKAKMGPAAWNRMQEVNKKLRDAMLDKRDELLPMRPGGRIQKFSTYAPPTSECEYHWFAEDSAQMKKVEQKLNVKVMYVFERSYLFRLWPEPADWDVFERIP